MFTIFEIVLMIVSCYLLFIICYNVFLKKSPRENGEQQRKSKTSEENSSECTMLGFLEKLPKGDPIPNECLNCQNLVECTMAKRAFDWYLGHDRAQS